MKPISAHLHYCGEQTPDGRAVTTSAGTNLPRRHKQQHLLCVVQLRTANYHVLARIIRQHYVRPVIAERRSALQDMKMGEGKQMPLALGGPLAARAVDKLGNASGKHLTREGKAAGGGGTEAGSVLFP